jgi:hypothetical protein
MRGAVAGPSPSARWACATGDLEGQRGVHIGTDRHTNIQTTINTYGHLFPNVRERIWSALDDMDDVQAAG